MSESHSEHRPYEQEADDVSFVDHEISTIIGSFVASLQNGHRAHFRTLEDLSQKIDHICWEWAQHPDANPEGVIAAVGLRSLAIVRSLETVIMPDTVETEKIYRLPPLNPFWKQVETSVDEHIKRLALQKIGLEDHTPVIDSNDPLGRTLILLQHGDYRITKCYDVKSGSEQVHQVVYSASLANAQQSV